MKYFLIAGEASGDLHAARLMEALHARDKQAVFVGLGGDKMQAAGCTLYRHYSKMAYMGYTQVLLHLSDIRANVRIAEQALLDEQPDELILIDYPGFNLHMAKFAKQHLPRTRVTYYIPPKIWAWKRWRVHNIGKFCDRILGIFPFEPAFYARYGYTCTYVGNPTAEQIDAYLQSAAAADKSGKEQSGEYVALLPGSRRHEVENSLPRMIAGAEEAIHDRSDIERIVVTRAPGLDPALYDRLCAGHPMVELTDDTYQAVLHARAAVVNSGTATLETALLGCPQVAVYDLALGRLLAWFRPIMFDIPHFTLVNIVAEREVIKELLMYEFTAESVRDELRRLLTDRNYADAIREGYADIRRRLGTTPSAANAAELIFPNEK